MNTDIYVLCLMVNKETELVSRKIFFLMQHFRGSFNYEALKSLIIITITNNNAT